MACAAIRPSCTFLNSYITVVNSPGCTCTERWAGLKLHGPRALASNSTVIVRDLSTCVFAGSRGTLPATPLAGTWRSESGKRLMPVTSPSCRSSEVQGHGAAPAHPLIHGKQGTRAGGAVAGRLPLGERQDVDARHFADLPVDRNQRIAEGEHAGRNHQQFAEHLGVGAVQVQAHDEPSSRRAVFRGGFMATKPPWP